MTLKNFQDKNSMTETVNHLKEALKIEDLHFDKDEYMVRGKLTITIPLEQKSKMSQIVEYLE